MQCLIFRLYGPMASWGVTAVGGVRSSASIPTRSAVLGLLAAALGIRRNEEERLAELSTSYTIAVKAESEGTLLRDYHTAQVPSADRKALLLHRKAELEFAHTNINTILSTRDYRADGHWLVAVAEKPQARFSLAELEAALLEPAFPLYLGRKSCPLAAPLKPQLVEAEDVHQALNLDLPPISFREEADRALYSPTIVYQWEVDNMGIAADESSEIWDEPGSRKRWQFARRLVHSARKERS